MHDGAQVVLLDPVQYPGAMKAFAREVCRNDLLNFGRLHFFFPDSRMSLDLNTDKTLKVSRFVKQKPTSILSKLPCDKLSKMCHCICCGGLSNCND